MKQQIYTEDKSPCCGASTQTILISCTTRRKQAVLRCNTCEVIYVVQVFPVEQHDGAVHARAVFSCESVEILINEQSFGHFRSVTEAEYAVVGKFPGRVISWEGF